MRDRSIYDVAVLVARLNSLENTSSNAKAAVMIRESLNANAVFAMTAVVANPTGTGTAARFEYRKTAGGRSTGADYKATTTPKFIRIVRKGSTISSYISATNGNWELFGSTKVSFGTTVFVGLAATSNIIGTATVAEFSDVSILGGTTAAKTTASTTAAAQGSEGIEADVANFSVFPNPAVSEVTIEISESTIQSVAIYDLLGKEMKVVNFNTPTSSAQMDVSGLTKGLFLMKVHTVDGRTLDHKFFKQ